MDRTIHTSFHSVYILPFLLAITIVVSACDDNPVDHHATPQPGFALTFDDTYVKEWYGLREILASYDVRATFFVTRFAQLTDDDINKLRELEQGGGGGGARGR